MCFVRFFCFPFTRNRTEFILHSTRTHLHTPEFSWQIDSSQFSSFHCWRNLIHAKNSADEFYFTEFWWHINFVFFLFESIQWRWRGRRRRRHCRCIYLHNLLLVCSQFNFIYTSRRWNRLHLLFMFDKHKEIYNKTIAALSLYLRLCRLRLSRFSFVLLTHWIPFFFIHEFYWIDTAALCGVRRHKEQFHPLIQLNSHTIYLGKSTSSSAAAVKSQNEMTTDDHAST